MHVKQSYSVGYYEKEQLVLLTLHADDGNSMRLEMSETSCARLIRILHAAMTTKQEQEHQDV